MNKIMIFTLGATAALFGAQLPEDLKFEEGLTSNHSYMQEADSEEAIGHFNFRVGPAILNQSHKNSIPVFLFGYQSRLVPENFFQSQYVEFGGGYVGNNKSAWYFPRIGMIKYFNPKSQNRVYTSFGGSLAHTEVELTPAEKNEKGWTTKDAKTLRDTYFGTNFALGLEMGKPSESINKIEISYDLPTLSLDENEFDLKNGVAMLTYSVGF